MKGNFLLRSAGLIYLISDLVYLRMHWVDTLILSVPVYVTIGGTKSRDDSYADLCHQLLETSIVDIVAAERDCSATIPGHYHRSVLRTEYIRNNLEWPLGNSRPSPFFPPRCNAIPPRSHATPPHKYAPTHNQELRGF